MHSIANMFFQYKGNFPFSTQRYSIIMKLEMRIQVFNLFSTLHQNLKCWPMLTSIPTKRSTNGFKSCFHSSSITILCKIMQASIMSIMVFKSHCLQMLATMAHCNYKTPKAHSTSLRIAFYIMAKC